MGSGEWGVTSRDLYPNVRRHRCWRGRAAMGPLAETSYSLWPLAAPSTKGVAEEQAAGLSSRDTPGTARRCRLAPTSGRRFPRRRHRRRRNRGRPCRPCGRGAGARRAVGALTPLEIRAVHGYDGIIDQTARPRVHLGARMAARETGLIAPIIPFGRTIALAKRPAPCGSAARANGTSQQGIG